MDKYVYISYESSDRQFAESIVLELIEKNIRFWYDKLHVNAGENWSEISDSAYEDAPTVLFLLSKESISYSSIVSTLWQAATVKNKKRIAVYLDPAIKKNLLYIPVRGTTIDYFSDTKKAINQIVDYLGPEYIIKSSKNRISEQSYLTLDGKSILGKSKGYVFINYAEEDTEFVMDLKTFMKDRGYAYWDYQESDRDYHSQLFLEIEGIIQGAAATLTVISEHWKRSKWTVKEYFYADEIGNPIFLLRPNPTNPILAVAGIPYIDFAKDKEEGFKKLGKELDRKKL